MKIEFTQKHGKSIQVEEEDLLINVLEYLRAHFPNQECVLYEIRVNNNITSEGPAAVLSLIRNPQLVNHYNKIIKL